MAQEATTDLPEIDALSSLDTEDLHDFVDESISSVEAHLRGNRQSAARMGDLSETVDDVLSNENIDHVQVRARPFENPRITFWLKDCPMWANDAWNSRIYPFGLNAYNGKVYVNFDVRPF